MVKDIGEWEHNPSDLKYKTYSNISIQNIWKHKETNTVIIHYFTINTVQGDYLELFENPKSYNSAFRKIKNLFSSDNINEEISKVTITAGNSLGKYSTREKTIKAAEQYMREHPQGEANSSFSPSEDNIPRYRIRDK